MAVLLIVFSIIALNPLLADAKWERDNKGWWYSESNSWITGWKEIDGELYYFDKSGYMAHDTVIDGNEIGSNGAVIHPKLENSTGNLDSLSKEILKNISIQNPSFSLEYSGDMNEIGKIIENKMDILRYTNSYETYNISTYKVNMSSWSNSDIVKLKFTFDYRMTAQMESALDLKAREIVASITDESMSKSRKEREIHDWIINNTKYDESYTIYDPYNTLFKHTGVCQGYALLAQKMFTIAGIESMIVEGTANGEDHAWNMVYIDNKWSHVDLTWDDPVSSKDMLRYDYYNLSDKEMARSCMG